ncbi:ATP-binding protein [Candidatus Parabeggiatoa sp. HSG14]|uniref:ATP-binding protein n=1 Tax=Candidatus Parabeggiatoa sp. HSG14 TaxID=3055593 RepID=UPI0025A7EC54|nr:ATP-binding protein [Thiotrichales bacterium HSG14]
MLLFPFFKKQSLTRNALVKMGIRIAIIIIAVTLISYWHVISILESQTLEQLEKYIIEKGQRESSLFFLSEDNHTIFKQEFLSRFQQIENKDFIEKFNQLFQTLDDGTTRMRPEFFSGIKQQDSTAVIKEMTGFIGQEVIITDKIRHRIIITYDMLTTFGPAWASWRDRFPNLYVSMPENIILVNYLGTSWGLDAPANLKLSEEIWVAIADKIHNPTRKTVWTAFYYDAVAKDWMVSCATPVDVSDQHLITIGHDILLNKLVERTVNDYLEGTYNIIFREDGRLIIHPDKINEIREKGGQVDIPNTGDQHLINIFQQVKERKSEHIVIDNPKNDEYLAVTKIHGPEWYFVTVYPKSLLAGLAFETARFILILGMISLLIEVTVLFFVLRQQVAKPLNEFIGATEQITVDNFDIKLDVTRQDELGRLAQSFNLMSHEVRAREDSLRQANKLKDDILANTSHELRTPLNGIIGIAASLIEGATGDLSPTTKTNLAMIVSSGKRLSSLVNDILDFSKLKQKDLELQLKPVGLREIVEIILNLNQPLVAQKPVELINSISPDLPPAYADEDRLQQIFHNLIGNAIKFTDNGYIEISAKVEIDNGNDKNNQPPIINSSLIITVSDTGIGIPENKLKKIFESFEQADGGTTRKYGGTGLGLAISQQLIHLHGGHIWVESQLNEGSQFCFTLPVANPQSSTPELSTHSILPGNEVKISTEILSDNSTSHKIEEKEREDNLLGECNLLIVDDEPINLQVLSNYLSLQNYSVVQACSGADTLTLMENGLKPDAILLDVMMPGMTGYEVTKKLREKWPANELPVLLLTAKNQVADLVMGLQAGANDYLIKPFSKDELLARLQTHLRIRQLNLENIYTKVKAEEASIAKVRFMANMSHELRTPLHAIIGFSEIIKMNTQKSEEQTFANEILIAGEHLLTLINDILNISNIEMGKIEVDCETFYLSTLINEVVCEIQPIIEKQGHTFKTEYPQNLGVITADVTKVEQILFNILKNAAKFTDKGTITFTVTYHSDFNAFKTQNRLVQNPKSKIQNMAGWFSFEIADTGIGIAPEKIESIFKIFTQVDDSYTRKYGGCGLGLSISQYFCQAMGGKIIVNSTPNKGSVFTIWLPAQMCKLENL